MEILRFKLSGKNAFFKKPEVNTYCYFTYGNIHKVALLGIFGAILGYSGYTQIQDMIKPKKKKTKLEPSYPEFYERLKDLKVAILPLNEKGNIPKKIQAFNNSVGYASREQGGNLIVKEQWLENPAWEICVLIDCEEAEKLKDAIQNHKCVYYPYLGKNDHLADIEFISVDEAKLAADEELYRIDSFIKRDDIELVPLDSEDLDELLTKEEIRVYSQFKYEEALPYTLDEWVNNYKLERFVYTGSFLEVNNEDVYCLDNKVYTDKEKKDNIYRNKKYVVFY
ncbi:type I-B CRISPR-associated protein Cas5b [Megamonas hypermegale]|uniref:type I-B CRISPR-associated protein Cas5b n=1 Tax=Megamonas hypermegale TaxID=158847 RepID=UPI001959DD6A|nr:type I-B CRISPR-associated protein Cas5b [Megamonas hypermegale]MBM6760016.1 type I-B CRISPR-associated protein Cas5 [Megamonas hypermegale]